LEKTLAYPFTYLKIQAILAICRSKGKIDMNLNILAPNISFDYYKINGVKVGSTTALTKQLRDGIFDAQSGFLSIDQENRIIPMLPSESSLSKEDMVGVWVSSLPED